MGKATQTPESVEEERRGLLAVGRVAGAEPLFPSLPAGPQSSWCPQRRPGRRHFLTALSRIMVRASGRLWEGEREVRWMREGPQERGRERAAGLRV